MFTVFILTDPKYYNLKRNEVGKIIGTIGLVGELVVMLLSFFTGPMMDVLGRKAPIVFGLILNGISLLAIPFFNEVYPYFFICKMGLTIVPIFI